MLSAAKKMASFFSSSKRSSPDGRFDYAQRALPEFDRDTPVALRMNGRQREVYFRCIDLAVGGGFDYQGGSLAGGSMPFLRERLLLQQLYLWVGNTENVGVTVTTVGTNSRTSFPQKYLGALEDYARSRMREDVFTLLRIKSEDAIETLSIGDGRFVTRFGDGNSYTVGSDFTRVRTHIAMMLDLCDDVERYAEKLMEQSK